MWRAFAFARNHFSRFHDSRPQVFAYQLQYPRVGNPLSQLPLQDSVVHVVKESLDVHVHDPTLCLFGQIALRCLDRVMRAPFRPESPTMLAHVRLAQGMQLPVDQLLDEPV